MADTILVVVEQREGKLNRVSWETITAGQAIAAATGWTLEAAVVGSGVASIAAEVAAQEVGKGLRHRIAEARAVHSRRIRGRTETIPQQSAEAGPDATHVSGARLCTEARNLDGPHGYQRLHRVQAGRWKAAVYAPDVPRQVCGRRQLQQRGSVVRDLPERRISWR